MQLLYIVLFFNNLWNILNKKENIILSLCWRISLHLISSFLCFILFSQTICNINQQLQNPKNRKKCLNSRKREKNVMKDSFYIKLATYLVPSPSRSITLGIWQGGRLQQKLIALHSNFTHASLFSAFLFPHCTTTMKNL